MRQFETLTSAGVFYIIFLEGGVSIAGLGRYGLLESGEVVDKGFIYSDDFSDKPKVFRNGKWVLFNGAFGEIFDSKALSDEEAFSIISGFNAS